MEAFDIISLDHVALLVKDMEASAKWYESVFGLQRYQLPQWGNYPIFLLAGKTGIALFPAGDKTPPLTQKAPGPRIDHFAFRVSGENFRKARQYFEKTGISYEFQDHFYFHSIYLQDPDGHIAELTTIVVEEDGFYHPNREIA